MKRGGLYQRSRGGEAHSRAGAVNGSDRKSRACIESHDSGQDDVFHEVAGRAWTHCTRSWRSARPFTTVKSNEMKLMNLQEEVKKLEEQESGINVACPMEDEVSWVIKCNGDHVAIALLPSFSLRLNRPPNSTFQVLQLLLVHPRQFQDFRQLALHFLLHFSFTSFRHTFDDLPVPFVFFWPLEHFAFVHRR